MSHYRELGNPEEVSGRNREPRWLRKVQEVWGLVPCSYPGSLKAANLFMERCRALQGCKVTHTQAEHQSHEDTRPSPTLQTHTALSSPAVFLNAVALGLTYYSEQRWWAHTENSRQTTRCPSGPDSYLLIPAESMPDITLSYETACSVIPSISSDMARGKKMYLYVSMRDLTHCFCDLVERKSGYEQ